MIKNKDFYGEFLFSYLINIFRHFANIHFVNNRNVGQSLYSNGPTASFNNRARYILVKVKVRHRKRKKERRKNERERGTKRGRERQTNRQSVRQRLREREREREMHK